MFTRARAHLPSGRSRITSAGVPLGRAEEAALPADPDVRPAVGAVEPHRDEARGRGHVDPVGLGAEVGPARAPGGDDQVGLAAGRRAPRRGRSRPRRRSRAGSRPSRDGGPGGRRSGSRRATRPGRGSSAGTLVSLTGAPGAVAGPLPEVAAVGRPAHVGQGLAVGRPGREELAGVLGRELGRLARGEVHQVEPGHRREGQPLAVRARGPGPGSGGP